MSIPLLVPARLESLKGSPERLRKEAARHREVADSFQRAESALGTIADVRETSSDAVDKLRAAARARRGDVRRMRARYNGFADAISTYASKLEAMQESTRRIRQAHGRICDDLEDRLGKIGILTADIPFTPPAEHLDLASRIAALTKEARDLRTEADQQEAKYEACKDDLDRAARVAVAAIKVAEEASQLNDGMFGLLKRAIGRTQRWVRDDFIPFLQEATAALGALASFMNELAAMSNFPGAKGIRALELFVKSQRELQSSRTRFEETAGSLQDQAEKLASLETSPTGTAIRIERTVHLDGSVSFVVYLPGTDGRLVGVADWWNAALAGLGVETSYAREVRRAMRAAGIGPEDRVQLVGHSQGGLVASVLAGDASFRAEFGVDSIVTYGSYAVAEDMGDIRALHFLDREDKLTDIGAAGAALKQTFGANPADVDPYRNVVFMDNLAEDNHGMSGFEGLDSTGGVDGWKEDFAHHYSGDDGRTVAETYVLDD